MGVPEAVSGVLKEVIGNAQGIPVLAARINDLAARINEIEKCLYRLNADIQAVAGVVRAQGAILRDRLSR